MQKLRAWWGFTRRVRLIGPEQPLCCGTLKEPTKRNGSFIVRPTELWNDVAEREVVLRRTCGGFALNGRLQLWETYGTRRDRY